MFIQLSRPINIKIKLGSNDDDKYVEKYTLLSKKNTFLPPVIKKDRLQQLHIDENGRLTTPIKRFEILNNTLKDWVHLKNICKYDFRQHMGYLDAIYSYNVIQDQNTTTEPYDILDEENYKEIDNNAICYKYIDYSTNKKATFF